MRQIWILTRTWNLQHKIANFIDFFFSIAETHLFKFPFKSYSNNYKYMLFVPKYIYCMFRCKSVGWIRLAWDMHTEMKLRLHKSEKLIKQIIDYDILKYDSTLGRLYRSSILLALNWSETGIAEANLSYACLLSVCVYTSAVIKISSFSERKSLSTQAPFLGRLQKSRKAPSCFPHVRSARRMYQHWTNFSVILYWGPLCKTVNKIQVLFKLDKNIGHFIWSPKCVFVTNGIVTIKALCSSEIVSDGSCSRGGINIMRTRTRRIVTLYAHCLSCYIKPSVQNFQAQSVHVRRNRNVKLSVSGYYL